MTALNVIQTPHSIRFSADTAHYGATGIVRHFSPKLLAIPAARAAIGAAGLTFITRNLFAEVLGARSIDELRQQIEMLVPTLFQECCRDPKLAHVPTNEPYVVLLGGFSPSRERQLWKLNACVSDDIVSFERLPDDRWTFTPSISISGDEIASAPNDTEGFELRMLERQRQTPIVISGWNGNSPSHIVGGDAQSVAVSFDRIICRTMRRWPDLIGASVEVRNHEG
jgi:hypothetical protein